MLSWLRAEYICFAVAKFVVFSVIINLSKNGTIGIDSLS